LPELLRRKFYLSRQSGQSPVATFCVHRRAPMAYVVLRGQTKEGVGIDGRSLGNGTAFSAVAPSQRPVYDAHQSKIFESGISVMSPGPEYLDA
jgi:hypothetical protein